MSMIAKKQKVLLSQLTGFKFNVCISFVLLYYSTKHITQSYMICTFDFNVCRKLTVALSI